MIDANVPIWVRATPVAYVITSKLADHLPLYRLERIFARDGVHIADSTMCGWILAVDELVSPLVLLMKGRVKQSKVINTDETRVPVQAKGKCRSGRIWDWIGQTLVRSGSCCRRHARRRARRSAPGGTAASGRPACW